MGLAFTKLFARLFSKKEMRILMVNAGHLLQFDRNYLCPAARARLLLRVRLSPVASFPQCLIVKLRAWGNRSVLMLPAKPQFCIS